ncbi:DolP-mannose mannosyltransferase [Halorarius litoreus]|uniref:DolP-mannose mannosyltransferase n=1 Tax=Halorarius litoreus TaxID=2962676 RepID=UPI0020CD1A9C|nr:DolP-mannose mannosyltransferase [Halorarius litoreus]
MAPETDRLAALPTRETVTDRCREARAFFHRHPLVLVALVALLLETYVAYRVYAPLGPNEWPVLKDSVIFEYIGWHVAHGTELYTGIWEVKPPLAFELLAVLAALAGDSVATYHTLALLVSGGAVVGSSVVVAAVVHELTEDTLGTLAGGLTVFALPMFYWRALVGFKSKYAVVVLGLLVLWLALRDRPLLAGVTAAACIGFWQLSVVFPLVGLGLFVQRGAGVRRYLAAGTVAGLVVLLPVVWWGSFPAMLAEAVLTPLLVTESHSLQSRIQFILRVLGITIPVVLVGVVGLAGSFDHDRISREWPLLVTLAYLTFVMLFVDFDTVPDVFVWFAVVAVGVGLAVSRGTGDAKRTLTAAVLGLVLLSTVTMGGFGTGNTQLTNPATYDTTTEMEVQFLHNTTERQHLFWTAAEPPTCRVFVGQTQYQAIKAANLSPEGERYWEAECGQFGPIWEAVVEKYS